MKSVFLCTDKNMPDKVYSDEAIKRIEKYSALDKTVYGREEVLENPALTSDTEYIFSTWKMPQFTEQEIKTHFPRLKCVFFAAGTVQYFARPFLACGVKVFSGWAANAVPVAEYTAAQIILANKGFFANSRVNSREDYDKARQIAGNYRGNYDVKIGLLGAGMIGKKVIELLKPYRLEILVFDKFMSEAQATDLGVKKAGLEEIFASCAVVSNHLANNPQTRRILGGGLFESMPPYATFINTGRGAQVCEETLISALKNRADLTAILDVTEPEPPLEKSPLYTLPNCILTPHIAGSFGNEACRLSEYISLEFEKYVNNKPCNYEVTAEMLETMA